MKILNQIFQKAKKINATIILPEANQDRRVYKAAKSILKSKLSNLVVFGKSEEFEPCFKVSHCQIIDIETYPKTELAKQLYELRKHKGMTEQEANSLIKQPLFFAMLMLLNNMADGVVAGACNTTAQVLLPALQIIKTKPNKQYVTGSTLMVKNGCKPLLFGDVSLIVAPTSEMLAETAISNAEFMQQLGLGQPKVAMLSFSTHGSANHETITTVAEAVKIAKQKSKFLIDGEMQADSALNLQIAKQKGVKSEVGGNANVLIFPNLDAGNISYKLVAQLGQYTAIGPIMLNFKKPVNDLSRGSTIEEIISTVAITKLQTQI